MLCNPKSRQEPHNLARNHAKRRLRTPVENMHIEYLLNRAFVGSRIKACGNKISLENFE